MNFDRNTIIGFALLGVLLFLYFWNNSKEQVARQREQARIDSIARTSLPKADTAAYRMDSLRADSMVHVAKAGIFGTGANGVEDVVTVENEVFKIGFTNKGAQPKFVELKKFKSALDSQQVELAASSFNKISYAINSGVNTSAQTADLFFSNGKITPGTDGSQVVTFELKGGDSTQSATYITHQFIVYPNEYKVDMNITLEQPDKILTQNSLNLLWQNEMHQQESDISFEKQNTQVGFMEDGSFDYFTIGRRNHIDFQNNVSWIGVRQRFFNTYLWPKNGFANGRIDWTIPADSSHVLVQSTAAMQVKVTPGATATVPLSIFYGPADYNILKKYDAGFSKLVNLGQGVYAFVRPLNQYIVYPLFNFFKSFSHNYGIIIVLLTLVIRLLISPITYRSYLSGAKMKVLRPEISQLKEKFGNDQQAMSMEQMKLFREAGVNPLGGCIPALIQIPIFIALYSFFNSAVDLRGADFLWSSDLSAFDAPIKFGVNIPLLGNHLSLFTITATITSFLISLYGMSMSPDNSNPMMKYMMYLFPIMYLFFFNRLPSGLTWYYTVSNVITLMIQFVIQTYIIDHDKILAKIQEFRKKPKTKSKWQERLEQMQEQQKTMQQQQKKK
ncbi:MAG: membrane protein insertase YidC [Niabella sp.]